MNDIISYKIQDAFMLPYREAIDEQKMDYIDNNNEIIASSRIYLVCSVKKSGIIRRKISKPIVLYVGETFNKKKRFSTHKKLLKATSLISRNEELLIYFLHIRFSYIGTNQFNNNPMEIFNDIKNIDSKSSVRLLERLFIKLFRPILNEKNNDKIIAEDKLINKKLIQTKIEKVVLDIGMNEKLFQFKGGNRTPEIDLYTFDLKKDRIINGIPEI